MPIYYRADARSPEEIFHSGFKPRFFYQFLQGYTKPEWWRTGVRINFDPECVSEAESSNVVCMTTCFESAPIFPVDNTISTYVYIIELPDHASHIKHLKNFVGKNLPIWSIIVFSDRCVFKDVTIRSNDVSVINHDRVASVVAKICHQTKEIYTKTEINDILQSNYHICDQACIKARFSFQL